MDGYPAYPLNGRVQDLKRAISSYYLNLEFRRTFEDSNERRTNAERTRTRTQIFVRSKSSKSSKNFYWIFMLYDSLELIARFQNILRLLEPIFQQHTRRNSLRL